MFKIKLAIPLVAALLLFSCDKNDGQITNTEPDIIDPIENNDGQGTTEYSVPINSEISKASNVMYGSPDPISVGDAIPSIVVTYNNGKMFNLKEFEGTILVKNWATWCSVCRRIEPDVIEFAESIEQDFVMAYFSLDNQESALFDYVDRNNKKGLQVFDRNQGKPSLSFLLGKSGIPNFAVIKDGVLVYSGGFNKTAILDAMNGQ
ncbi:MAG: hypothetical protein Kapaf2KO_22260 [Candidatus Kapaibacteriales bacterium]